MRLQSQVIITSRFEETIARLRALAQEGERFEIIRPDEGKSFQVKDAKRAIEKAYMASYERTIVVLVSDVFSEVVQNKLLKAIEEPPAETEFVLMLHAKATLLGTVRSRLPITIIDEDEASEPLALDMEKLDIRSVYAFIQEHKRTDAHAAKTLLEKITSAAIRSRRYALDERTLEMFHRSRLSLDKGSPGTFVLTGVLLKLLARKSKTKS